jgi:hypothetical protein
MNAILAPAVPMYLQGWAPVRHVPRFPHLVNAPKIPLHQLGWMGASVSSVAAALIGPVVVSASQGTASSALESAAAGAAQGAKFGPIGAAVGAIAGAIAGIFGSHAARAAAAKTEDAAVNEGVAAFDAALAQLNQQFKSGALAASDVQSVISQQVMPGYWGLMTPKIQVGRNGCSSGGACPPPPATGNPCTGSIGAACCVGCYDLDPSLNNPDGVFAALAGQSTASGGRYVSNIAKVYGSSYGTTARAAYTIDWTPPASSGVSASGILSDLTGSGGGSSVLPLALAALAAWAVFA